MNPFKPNPLLWAINAVGKPIYEGTVPPKVIARRRARNKVARMSRRINRGNR